MLYSYYSCDSKSMNLGLFTFSGFSVDCCLNREKVICYQLEENNLPTTECFRAKVKEVWTNVAVYTHVILRIHIIGGQRSWGLQVILLKVTDNLSIGFIYFNTWHMPIYLYPLLHYGDITVPISCYQHVAHGIEKTATDQHCMSLQLLLPTLAMIHKIRCV